MKMRHYMMLGAASLCYTGIAVAQDSGEIVVTANKREQSINDIGISVVAISGDQLRARNITSLADLTQAVPGLTFSNTRSGTPVLTLRGIGFFDTIGALPGLGQALCFWDDIFEL